MATVLQVLVVPLGAFVLWLGATAILIWGERRLLARMQTRLGPNRLGPLGLLQTIADGAKLFFKEDIAPSGIDRVVYFAAPGVSALVALLTFAVIPSGGSFQVGGQEVALQVWDPNIGLLWILAMSSIGVYGIVLAGWSSGSKYPLLGGVRSSAQLVSYELSMGLGLAAVFVHAGTLRSSEIVANQAGTFAGFIPAWHIIPMAPAFVLFFVAITAETQRVPFDLPEAEGELVAGFHTEYTGAKFAMFFLAEFMNVVTMSAVVVTAFLGGPSGPMFGPVWLQVLLGIFYFALKTFVFVFIFIWAGASLPRFRYDRLMDLGWKVMLPLGLVWVMASALFVIVRQEVTQGAVLRVAGVVLAVIIVAYLLAPLFSRAQEAEEPSGSDGDGGGGSAPGLDAGSGSGSGHAEPVGAQAGAGTVGDGGSGNHTPDEAGR
jgi:NADH-quinone oxidoreductase subunit H